VNVIDTKLADRTAATILQPPPSSTDAAAPSPSNSKQSLRPGTPKPKPKSNSSPGPATDDAAIAQMRADLASTQKTRSELETRISTTDAELTALKTTSIQQQKRIALLEKAKEQLERRTKDRAEELKGKGRLVEEVQDEMVSLNLQLNMAEQEREKLKRDNEELTKRWMEKMEGEARKMNDRMGWRDGERKQGADKRKG
jgi:chromosome segregation ATPase